MKLAHLPILLGLKRPKPRLYEQSTVVVDLAQDGPIDFAVWHHPNERASFPSQPEIDELRTFIRPGDFCIDIGAQTGDTAVPIALACGPTGACLALEPNPYCFPVLEANARLNRSRLNIIPLRYAVGEREETMTFNYSDPGYCNGGVMPDIARWRHGHLFPLDVEARRLESVLAGYGDRAERLRYIKIDAEGGEYHILRGGFVTIQKFRPVVSFEFGANAIENYGICCEQMGEYWLSRRYILSDIQGHLLQTPEEFAASAYAQNVWDYIAVPMESTPVIKRIASILPVFLEFV